MKRILLLACALGVALPACGGDSQGERPPLVCLISVDTLRADRLGVYGSERGLTPRLDAFAAGALVFESGYAPSSFTVPSMSAVHTSLYPEENAIYINEHRLHDDVPTLAEGFGSIGYRTGAVVSNFVLRKASGLDRGFERFDDRQPEVEIARKLPERTAGRTTDDALAMLDVLSGNRNRVFLWVHYQDPHGPYTPPNEFLGPLLKAERALPGADRRLPFGKDHRGLDGIPTYQRLGPDADLVVLYLASYHAEIRYTDQEIGRLLDGFAERDLLDEALIAFIADHGEGLGENDYWFAHGEYLTDPLIRVPFLLRGPGIEAGRRTEAVGLIDVLPTLFARVGIAPPTAGRGVDLLATKARQGPLYQATLGGSTVFRYGLIEDGYQYILELDAERKPASEALRRLGNDSANLLSSNPKKATALREHMLELQQSLQRTRQPLQGELDPHAAKMMEGLGYVGDE